MTREGIISGLKFTIEMFLLNPSTGETITEPRNDMDKTTIDACRGAIELLEQKPCEDAISRADAQTEIQMNASRYTIAKERGSIGQVEWSDQLIKVSDAVQLLRELPSVNPQEPKTGHCKDCKYFEYDSVAKVDGIPLIVAHEICNKWGGGCKSKEDGYCFLFEPQESEVQNGRVEI